MRLLGWILLAAVAAGCGKKTDEKAPPKGAMAGAESPEAAFAAVIDIMRRCDGKALWGIFSTKQRKDSLAQLDADRKDEKKLQEMADMLGLPAEKVRTALPEELLSEFLKKRMMDPSAEKMFSSLGAPTAQGDDRRITVTAKIGQTGGTYSIVFVREGDLWKFDSEEETPEVRLIDVPK